MGTTTRYVPYDYRRVCDVCGNLRNISTMVQKPGSVWVCSYHPSERTELQLSDAIARQRPVQILPVPYPKPLNPDLPNTYRADDGATFGFVSRMVTLGAQYLDVTNGDGAIIPNSGLQNLPVVPLYSWAARYFYDFIQQNQGSALMLAQAQTQLALAASSLMALQVGFGVAPSSTQANDAFYGAFIDGVISEFVSNNAYTEDAATGGLALLYAYRKTGNQRYLIGARAAASFLRNVQAIGSNGTHFTSSDSAGTVRLYTGGLASLVAYTSGFYSDHRFYPTSLLALEFWNALKATDGDQEIGASTAVIGFSTTPQDLLSTAIGDLRAFWTDGVYDTTQNATVAGFTSAHPFEDFNAYPASKPNTTVTGTGSWEYQDGNQSTGSLVTGLNYAKGLGALYAFEGASDQVTDVDTFIRGLASNSSYQTPTSVSTPSLWAGSTGTYNAKQGIATYLDVRNSRNGSTLYDWGALGCVARLWAARHASDFKTARVAALGKTQRFQNGKASDGMQFDRIGLRGRSGLSFQTSFTETIVSRSRRVNDAVAAAQWGTAYRV